MKLMNIFVMVLMLSVLGFAETAQLTVIAVDKGPAGYATESVGGVTIYLRDSSTGAMLGVATTNSKGVNFNVDTSKNFYVTTSGPSGTALGGKYGFLQELDGNGVPVFKITKSDGAYKLCRVSDNSCSSPPFLILYKIQKTETNGSVDETTEETKQSTCSDTDKFDLYTKGTVTAYDSETGKTDTYTEYCTNDGTVFEYYCDGVRADGYANACGDGYTCSAGACVKKAVENKCTDSDNGYNIYEMGYRNVNGITATEYCTQDGKLVELWCHGNEGYTKEVECQEGYYCTNGACVFKPTVDKNSTETANLPLKIYVLNSDIERVKDAYVGMYKTSDDSFVRGFYTDKNGEVSFYSWHMTAGEPVYFTATKDGKTYQGYLGKGPTAEYKDGKYCIYKSGVSECMERYSLGLFEVTSGKSEDSNNENETEKPPSLPTDETTTPVYYTVAVQPGWNLVSVPFESGKLTSTDCDSNTIYTLNPAGRQYNKESLSSKTWFGFEGYWLKSDNGCKLQFTVESEDGLYGVNKLDETSGRFANTLHLLKGWNMIGAPYNGATLSEIAGTCTFTSGPWGYNSETKNWEKATKLQDGKGYFVKVDGNCVLGSELPPLPPS